MGAHDFSRPRNQSNRAKRRSAMFSGEHRRHTRGHRARALATVEMDLSFRVEPVGLLLGLREPRRCGRPSLFNRKIRTCEKRRETGI